MTYSLPFGLKQKPVNHYFDGGVIKFSVVEGKLFYTVKRIDKSSNSKLFTSEIKTKEHLDQLLQVKSFNDRRLLEVVN